MVQFDDRMGLKLLDVTGYAGVGPELCSPFGMPRLPSLPGQLIAPVRLPMGVRLPECRALPSGMILCSPLAGEVKQDKPAASAGACNKGGAIEKVPFDLVPGNEAPPAKRELEPVRAHGCGRETVMRALVQGVAAQVVLSDWRTPTDGKLARFSLRGQGHAENQPIIATGLNIFIGQSLRRCCCSIAATHPADLKTGMAVRDAGPCWFAAGLAPAGHGYGPSILLLGRTAEKPIAVG